MANRISLMDFLRWHGHKIPKREVDRVGRMTEGQVKNWMLNWQMKLDLDFPHNKEEIRQEVDSSQREVSEMTREVITTIKEKRVFYRVIQRAYDEGGSLRAVRERLHEYKQTVDSLGLADHVNEQYLAFKEFLNIKNAIK